MATPQLSQTRQSAPCHESGARCGISHGKRGFASAGTRAREGSRPCLNPIVGVLLGRVTAANSAGSLTFGSPKEEVRAEVVQGRSRGHNKGTITVTMRASKRQKEPSIALVFYKLPLSCALSRQRSGAFDRIGTGKRPSARE